MRERGPVGAIPILMYHQITPDPHPAFRPYTVSRMSFTAHMRWLAATGHTAISLDQLLVARNGRGALPPKPVVITFDDGYLECVRYAMPVLRHHGFTAIFYMVAGLAGRASEWLARELGIQIQFSLIDWDTARRLTSEGFACGSHSMTHARLTAIGEDARLFELAASRRLLEEHLGREVRHLAYPFGSSDAPLRRLVEQTGYLSACSTNPGLSGLQEDPFLLSRIDITGHDSLLDFPFRVRTGLTARAYVKRTLLRLAARERRHLGS
jgi:peptidoglycan/xylan/chitin deacetylase (PgdA/CDA1 family)